MKKNKVTIWISFSLLLLLVIVVVCTIVTTRKQRRGTLIINDLKSDSVMEHNVCTIIKYQGDVSARIPFLLVLSHLGAEITKEGDKVCIFVCNNMYELDFQKKEVIKKGDWFNILTGLAGYKGNYYCERDKDDLFLDDLTIRSALDYMGISTKVIIDYDNCEVIIKIT